MNKIIIGVYILTLICFVIATIQFSYATATDSIGIKFLDCQKVSDTCGCYKSVDNAFNSPLRKMAFWIDDSDLEKTLYNRIGGCLK